MTHWYEHPQFQLEMNSLEARCRERQYSGCMLVEVHFRAGVPTLTKIREGSVPPLRAEIRLNFFAASSTA